MVAVIGAALTPFGRRKDGSSFRDWAAAAFWQALAMAELQAADIDALVLASESDFFTLQLNPAAVIADDLGLSGAALLRVEGGGDRKSTRLNSSHHRLSRMPSSA